jgi:hypothetical protein
LFSNEGYATRLVNGEDVNDTLVFLVFVYVVANIPFSCAIVPFVLASYNERYYTKTLLLYLSSSKVRLLYAICNSAEEQEGDGEQWITPRIHDQVNATRRGH